jgi:VanZ family protein
MNIGKIQIARLFFWVAMVGSYILAILPRDDVPKLTPFGDKSNHALAFSVLTLLLLYAYRNRYFSAFAWMLLYGIFIEISQLFTASRNSELLDVVADSIGAVIGILLYRLIRRFYPE